MAAPDLDLYRTWLAMWEEGHLDKAAELFRRLLDDDPDDPELHLFLASALFELNQRAECRREVHRAVDLGWDDPSVLLRVVWLCLRRGDFKCARKCVDRAKQVMPRDFLFKEELREADRHLKRRVAGREKEKALSDRFEVDPEDRRTATELARHLARTGREYAAYYVVSRGLVYHPRDRKLRRIERKLGKVVPASEQAEAKKWAPSGESRFID
jgi:Flp pilus assembly protein TadD